MPDKAGSERSAPAVATVEEQRQRIRAIARIAVISIIVSEVITIVLTRVFFGEVLEEGMLIALVCAGPISVWIAQRELHMRDVIARQRDELVALNTKLQQRNLELDSFSRSVAHDLKNPLTAIVGLADMLALDSCREASEDTRASIDSIRQSGRAAAGIVEGLLLLHRIGHEDIEMHQVDPDASVTRALTRLAEQIEEHGAVICRTGEFPDVCAYGPWLDQIWVNLIGNAVKYGGSPPLVTLHARLEPDGFARFEVIDNGKGIPAQDRERIFHEFQRGSHADVAGHGLGLAIVKRIVDRLGGAAGVRAAPDQGALFWFSLPAVPAEAASAKTSLLV